MERQLKRKIHYFIKSPYRGRADIRSTLRDLSAQGRLAIVGGMLRDVALFGNAGFRSDLDLVIDPYDLAAFDRRMANVGARVNRFGGYSLPSHKWQVDVWPLERTWAHREGYVRVRTIWDLRDATFFRCDAIVYDFASDRIGTAPGYFDELKNKLLDINLRPNPNPKGNAVRAFRYALLKGFQWKLGVAQFVAETIDEIGWKALVDDELRSFRSQHIETIRIDEFERALREYLASSRDEPFAPGQFQRIVQLELPHVK